MAKSRSAKQVMPRGRVGFAARPKGTGKPMPKPKTGTNRGTRGNFTSRPKAAKINPRSTKGSRPAGAKGGAFGFKPGRAGSAFINPRGSGRKASPRFSRRG